MPADIDTGSRYGPVPPPPKPMHNTYHGNAPVQQRHEVNRVSTKLSTKWMDAAERGEMARIQQLLSDGQDINEVCWPQTSTALYVAARRNNCRLAELLLKKGADPAVLTDDLVSPCWIAISRGFDEMVKLLLDQSWSAGLVKQMKTETSEQLSKMENCGVQQSHYDLAVSRRYWKCVHYIEAAIGVDPNDSRIPEIQYELPAGWAMGLTAAEPGQRVDMPMKPFYWKAFTKNADCVYEPPEGSKKLAHKGGGIFEPVGVVGA